MTLALYRVLKRQGMNVEEIGQIVVEIEEHRVRAYPSFVLRLLGRYLHSPIGKRRIKKMMVDDSRRHPPALRDGRRPLSRGTASRSTLASTIQSAPSASSTTAKRQTSSRVTYA